MLFVGCLYVTGYPATATVTGGEGNGFCDVVWEDPSGRLLSGESDCYDEPPGSRFEIRVSGWPNPGEPTLLETYVGMGLLLGLPPVALGAGRLVQLAWRRRLPPAPHLETPIAPEGSGGALADQRTVAALARVRRRAWLLAGAGIVGTCVLVGAFVTEIEADEDLRDVGVTTVGTVVQVEPDTEWSAGVAAVRFTADGNTGIRRVTLGGYADDYVEGDVVDVVYDPADPDRFIVDDALYGPEWTGWVIAPSFGLTLVAPFGVLRVAGVRRMRRLLTARDWARMPTEVEDLHHQWQFTTEGGSIWRSGRYLGWLPDWPSSGYSTCWVSDGTTAVFAPDPGGVLVLARRRR